MLYCRSRFLQTSSEFLTIVAIRLSAFRLRSIEGTESSSQGLRERAGPPGRVSEHRRDGPREERDYVIRF